MMRAASILVLAGGILTTGLAAIQTDRLEESRASGHHLLYLPSGKYLKVVTFGYNHLVADMIYLWSIQYYSNYQIEDRYDYLDQVYRRVIAELDPEYVDPYLLGSMIMSVEAGRDDEALALLDLGMANNPDEWILPFEAGFLCYHRLQDYSRAAKYFERAIQNPDAPAVARRLHAEMFNRQGDKRTSLAYWSEIHDTADTEYVRQVSWMHVHDLAIDVALEDLRMALQNYAERRGSYPARLSDLVREGILVEVPTDPEGKPFLYEPGTGKVSSRSRHLLERP